MRTTTFLSLLLIVALLVGCEPEAELEPTSTSEPSAQAVDAGVDPVESITCGQIANVHKVGELYLAGKPTPEDYPLLKEMGVKTIFNIRRDSETPDVDGAALAEAQGMAYIHLPWSGADQLTDERLDEMRRVLREAERPMLFHCASANRVGAGWLAYRVLDEGVDLDTALAEAKEVGMRTAAYETIAVQYIEAQQ